jgi:hypothetical protein
VIADAGLGKSRAARRVRGLAWQRGRTPSSGSARRAQPQTQDQPFGLLRDLLAARFELDDCRQHGGDDASASRRRRAAARGRRRPETPRRMRTCSASCSASTSPTARTCASSTTTAADPPRGLQAAVLLVLRLAAPNEAPLVLWLDDLHWADDGTLDFVEQLRTASAQLPLLLARAGPAGARSSAAPPGDATTRRRHRGAADRVAALGDARATPRRRRCSRRSARCRPTCANRSAVAPKAIRFTWKSSSRCSSTRGDRDRRRRLAPVCARALDASAVPKTLTGVLQAVLDRLAPAERARSSRPRWSAPRFLAAALAAIDPSRATRCRRSSGAAVVRRDDAPRRGAGEYRFGHQLLHQVSTRAC